jgi:YVTN family beta-propeller protein
MKFSRRSGFLVLSAFILLIELGCGDTYRPVANPIVTPGGQPQNTNFAFVASVSPNGNGATNQLDVSGDTSMNVTYAGAGSSYEAFLPPNNTALFVTNSLADTVTEIDLVSGSAPFTIGLLSGSHPVAIASTQSTVMYVANSGANLTCPNSGSLSILTTANLVVSSTVCAGLNPVAITQAPNGGQVYIANAGDNSVSVYNPNSQSLTSITTGIGVHPIALVPSLDGSYIYLATEGDGTNPGVLDLINTGTNTVVATVPLGISPTFALLDPNRNRLYVTNKGSNSVMVFDASNVNLNNNPAIPLLGTANVGSAPVSVAALPNGTKFYTANSGSNDVTVVSANSFQAVNTVPVGQNPVFVASEPSSTKIYVTNFTGLSTSIIKTVNDTVSQTINAPQQDVNCVNSSTAACPLQQPFMVLTK